MLPFLIAKIHQLYSKHSAETAAVRTTCWLSVVALTGTFALLIPMVSAIDAYYFDRELKIGRVPWTATALTLSYLYYTYIYRQLIRKKKIDLLVNKYQNTAVPAGLLYCVMAILPISLLLLGPIISTLLVGGKICGELIRPLT